MAPKNDFFVQYLDKNLILPPDYTLESYKMRSFLNNINPDKMNSLFDILLIFNATP